MGFLSKKKTENPGQDVSAALANMIGGMNDNSYENYVPPSVNQIQNQQQPRLPSMNQQNIQQGYQRVQQLPQTTPQFADGMVGVVQNMPQQMQQMPNGQNQFIQQTQDDAQSIISNFEARLSAIEARLFRAGI